MTRRPLVVVAFAAAVPFVTGFLTAGLPVAAADTPAAPAGGPAEIRGLVFEDTNRNARRDTGEKGIEGVAVSDQRSVVRTDKEGRYALPAAPGARPIFVSLPDGYGASGAFWRPVDPAAPPAGADFGLVRRPVASSFTFLHASDTHLDEASLPHLVRLRAIVAEKKPDFVVLTGDLVRDSLRVGEDKALPLFELVASELKKFPVPVFTVPGNHDIFGIERERSHVAADHPLYGRAMYRKFLGPDYYSFTWGGVRFLGLNSVDADDMSYYGHFDREQLAWVAGDLAAAPADVPVVTFNHIPMATTIEGMLGLMEDSPAPTIITLGGHGQFRHVVSNVGELLQSLGSHRLEIALGGHMHVSERVLLDTTIGRVRFHQAAAVVGPQEAGGLQYPSGATLYRVRDGHVDDGTFLPLEVH
ncbi:MAG TPA: metallophosphoesterase [Candidatus Polarisedimenticolia bacterium]|nr:metallophosphoesterase [Candidatus Polarisedimenticolia bacterium]